MIERHRLAEAMGTLLARRLIRRPGIEVVPLHAIGRVEQVAVVGLLKEWLICEQLPTCFDELRIAGLIEHRRKVLALAARRAKQMHRPKRMIGLNLPYDQRALVAL